MNSKINIKQSRFRDASWFDKVSDLNIPIIVGGAGGIGSWLVVLLARMLPANLYMFLYDNDRVEEVNMAGQLYSKKHIGLSKVDALNDIVKNFSDFKGLKPMNELYDKKSLKSPIMFSCFDNMKARKTMFENWHNEAKDFGNGIFIDGRLLAEQLQVLFVTLETADKYKKDYLFDDKEVEAENCSYKQTSHFAANIGAKMVQGFTNWFIQEEAELPFYYEEIGSLFTSLTSEDNE